MNERICYRPVPQGYSELQRHHIGEIVPAPKYYMAHVEHTPTRQDQNESGFDKWLVNMLDRVGRKVGF